MPHFIAFLRAINVGGARSVKMDTLRQIFGSLGFSGITTFIASGNVTFETPSQNARTLERKIERRLREALGYDVATFIRTDAELAEIAGYTPFPPEERASTAELNIIFLADTLDDESRQKVLALRTGLDEFQVHGREICWLRHKNQSTSAFSAVPLEKILARPFTIRGARTVKKMAMKYASQQEVAVSRPRLASGKT